MPPKFCTSRQQTKHKNKGAWLVLLGLAAGVCGCGGGGGSASGPPDPPAQTPGQPLLQALNTQGAVRLMPLGDSNTWGQLVPGSYRTQLYQKLAAEGVQAQFVGSLSNGPDSLPSKANEGHSGWTISQIAGSADGWLKAARPNVVLLMIGTNDVWLQQNPAEAPQRLGNLIDQITRDLPHSYLVVASVPPMASVNNNSAVVVYNTAIPAIVAAHAASGEHVSYADIYDGVPAADLMDEAHYNADGYAKMAQAWNNVLEGLTTKP